MQTNAVSAVWASQGVASFERPIDLVHLARQTLGDRSLEQEILSLYLKQARGLLSRIRDCAGDRDRADLAHTLVGSSRAVGAWKVAEAAETVELTAPDNRNGLIDAIRRLETAVEAACETIHELQRAH